MVLGRIEEVAYLLDLPDNARIHLVFHMSQLKKAVGDKHHVQPNISLLNDQMELVLEPENVTELRWNDTERDWEYLVQWKDQPAHEATWESVRPPILYQYRRRGNKFVKGGDTCE